MNYDQYQALAAELVAGHPTTGPYNADASLAAAELNATNRPANSNAAAVIRYLLTKNHRTNQGTDTQYTPTLGRLQMAASAAVGSDPFGRGENLSLIQVNACAAFLFYISSPHSQDVDLADTNLPLGTLNGAGVISSSHKSDIESLSQNQISRAQELGIGIVATDHVTAARAQ